MSAINLNGPGAINLENIQGMDLETALLAVQNQRATLLEEENWKEALGYLKQLEAGETPEYANEGEDEGEAESLV